MLHKLEDLLNLPVNKQIIDEDKTSYKNTKLVTSKKIDEQTAQICSNDMEELDKISAALPQVKGLGEIGDNELDSLALKALTAHEELMDLGMNVEARYSARIFEVASSMLKNAIDAKTAKMDKKLRMIDLQLRKQKVDKDTGKLNNTDFSGEGYIVTDRNSILERIRNMTQDSES